MFFFFIYLNNTVIAVSDCHIIVDHNAFEMLHQTSL